MLGLDTYIKWRQCERKRIFPAISWGFLGKRYRHGFVALPCGCHMLTDWNGSVGKRGLPKPGFWDASSVMQMPLPVDPLSSLHTRCSNAGFKFTEFSWQVGVSCLHKLSSLTSVPWCCGQQLHLAETNQKHSSSLRKRAEFMLNFIMLFFPLWIL